MVAFEQCVVKFGLVRTGGDDVNGLVSQKFFPRHRTETI